MNSNPDLPPPYSETPTTDRPADNRLLDRRTWCRLVSRMTFLGIDILATVLLIGGFLLLSFTDIFYPTLVDVTNLCDDPSYNVSPRPQPSKMYTYVAILTMFVVCLPLTMLKKITETGSFTKMAKQGLWEFWIISINAIILFILIEFLKCATGTPRPYFFSDKQIKVYFCDLNSQHAVINMEEVNGFLRKSFPSHRAALYTFSAVFTYFYVGHCNVNAGFNSVQSIVLTLMGPAIYHLLWQSVRTGENHFSDVVVGASVGGLFALVTIRCIYGKIFYSETSIPERRLLLSDYGAGASQLVPQRTYAPAIQNNGNNASANHHYESSETLVA